MSEPIVITLKNNLSDYHALIEYPDGQKSVRLLLDKLNNKVPVTINCRIKNFAELEVLYCLCNALVKNDFHIELVNYIYLFGMRSDRAFNPGEPNYFRDVIAQALRGGNIRILFPHNDIVRQHLNAQLIPCLGYSFEEAFDISALSPVYLWADQSADYLKQSINLTHSHKSSIFGSFEKKRENGQVKTIGLADSVRERLKSLNATCPIVIMDDLCDGGGTFIAEAQYLRDVGIKNPLYLFVGHGLFTKGLEPVLAHFDKILCTNSYQDINHKDVLQYKVI